MANAITNKVMQVELPYNSSDMFFLEKYLRGNGFRFNRSIGKFILTYRDEDDNSAEVSWHMRSTMKGTIVNTFEGTGSFPHEETIKRIVYPVVPKYSYTVKGESKSINNVIKMLFSRHFEVTALSDDGRRQLFERKENKVDLFETDKGKFMMRFNGLGDMSHSILQGLQMS